MDEKNNPGPADKILETPALAEALESDRFKRFLDHMPIAILVAELSPAETIIYTNAEFERISGIGADELLHKSWDELDHCGEHEKSGEPFGKAIVDGEDHVGTFRLHAKDCLVNVWSNVIDNEEGTPVFRLVAVAECDERLAAIEQNVLEKDVLLRELQHRVKNNLQMITALIRLEARNLPEARATFDRLAGRIEALALLYQTLSGEDEQIDLGTYLSQIASAVMRAHAVEGIRLDMKVDTWPVSVNVAMPTGLVVNEVLTNALKHAFKGRDGGTITLHSLVDEEGASVIVADDGVGLADGGLWPQPGKMSALIVQSLKENAKAKLEVTSAKDEGTRIVIRFARAVAKDQ